MDKGLKRFAKGRVGIAVAIAVCLLIALPASAFAATSWGSSYPAGSIGGQPGQLGVEVLSSPQALVSGVISIDGGAVKSFLSKAGTTAGHWSAVYAPAAGGTYTVTWTWVANTGSLSGASWLYAWPTSNLATGTHTITAVATDASGTTSAYNGPAWAFNITSANQVVPVAPGAGAVDAGCAAGCHQVNGNDVDWSRAPGMGPNCSVCHSGIDAPPHGFITAGANTHATLAVLMASNNNSTCIACHGDDFTAVASASSGVTGFNEHQGCSCHTYGEATDSVTGCVSCHSGQGGPHGFVNGIAPWNPTGTWVAASGHNTTTFGSIGAKTKFDGTQGVTLVGKTYIAGTISVTASAGPSGTYSVNQTGTVATTWAFPTQSVFWGTLATTDDVAPGTAMTGLSASSVITCADCHGTGTFTYAMGPHGATWTAVSFDSNYPGDYGYAELTKYVTSNNAYASATVPNQALDDVNHAVIFLTRNDALAKTNPYHVSDSAAASSPYWTPLSKSGIAMRSTLASAGTLVDRVNGTSGAKAVICAKCHDLENFNSDSWATEGANTAHDSHHQDQTDGSPQCVNCHIGLPHGWKRPRLLVDTAVDAAPYKSPDAIGYNMSGVGMLSLSAVNEHPLGGNVFEPYASGSGAASTGGYTKFNADGSINSTNLNYNPGHVGYAYWNEGQCEACNFHSASGGVGTAVGPRIK